MSHLLTQSPLLTGHDSELKRQEIRAYFHATYDRYEQLFELLANDDAYYKKPIPLRHPLIFYLGHTATFFINKLTLAGLQNDRINPELESLFAVGVDEMSWDDLNETSQTWPSVSEVMSYRKSVRASIDAIIQDTTLTLPIDWNHPWWIVLMGIEHEQIHLETSSVLIRQHALNYVVPHPAWLPCMNRGVAPLNTMINIPAGTVQLGKNKADPMYGWDNEYGHHTAEITNFQVSCYLVSNQEFLEFVESHAYTSDQFWEPEGRDWKNYAQAHHPAFWIRRGNNWHLRLLTEEIDMPWNWPVEVNYHEAKAFCNWKKDRSGMPVRLPTEDEWHRLVDFSGVSTNPEFKANIRLNHYASSCPVTEFRHGDRHGDLYDVIGNVWQWTETPIYPFEGFEVHPVYDDFTTPTFDGRHNLFMGGSWISCGNEALLSSRYAFRRHFFQHAGFRYVVAEAPAIVSSSTYETDKLLSEYAEFHYGDEYFGVPNFPATLARIATQAMGKKPALKALDLGCATGRASFELARHFEQVTGIDFSARFIGLGARLAEQGSLRYTLIDEGELVSYRERTLTDLNLNETRNKVTFLQGDACNLKSLFTGYDLILAANLIDRLYSPEKLLSTIHERLNPGGLLLIASPYTWLEEHTKRDKWVGGYKKDGENFTTFEGLKYLLEKHFKLIDGPMEVPFVIRETKRKFQHTLSEVTIWERIA